jgi:hypothetical protein
LSNQITLNNMQPRIRFTRVALWLVVLLNNCLCQSSTSGYNGTILDLFDTIGYVGNMTILLTCGGSSYNFNNTILEKTGFTVGASYGNDTALRSDANPFSFDIEYTSTIDPQSSNPDSILPIDNIEFSSFEIYGGNLSFHGDNMTLSNYSVTSSLNLQSSAGKVNLSTADLGGEPGYILTGNQSCATPYHKGFGISMVTDRLVVPDNPKCSEKNSELVWL